MHAPLLDILAMKEPFISSLQTVPHCTLRKQSIRK